MSETPITHRRDEGRYYSGVAIHAAPGVHEGVAELVASHVPPGGRILELGAGSGAFSMRLRDLGYRVEATELDLSDWRASDVPAVEVDLNTDFSSHPGLTGEDYDAVVAIELIEHLRNPVAFLTEAGRLASTDGVLIFSTPNVADLVSRTKFMIGGEFRYFSRELVTEGGHISVLPYWLLEELFPIEDLVMIERRFVGEMPFDREWKRRVTRAIDRLSRPVFGKVPDGASLAPCVAYACRPAS